MNREPADRRLSALRAMANQDASPVERDIAREKLRRLASLQVIARTREQEEAERLAAVIRADEAARVELLRKWERGDFAGMTFRAGSKTEARYRKSS